MADAQITAAVEKLSLFLLKKIEYVQSVGDQVKWLRDELEWMRGSLSDAGEKQGEDRSIRRWISDIRVLAQDAEDVIDHFTIRIIDPQNSRGWVMWMACLPTHSWHLYWLGKKIESIKERLQHLDKRRERYGIQIGRDEGMAYKSIELQRRLLPTEAEQDLEGMSEQVDKLMKDVIENEKSELYIGSIEGMGGLGKSTLAREVYNRCRQLKMFGSFAWITLSKDFRPRNAITELVNGLLESKEKKTVILNDLKEKSDEELPGFVHIKCFHGQKYLVVLDDVWRQEDWIYLKGAFPEEQGRIIITSRINGIPSGTVHLSYPMQPLGKESSRKLLKKKARVKDDYPDELKSIEEAILKKCDGLPLAITVVGGLLAKEGLSVSGWEKTLKGMGRNADGVSGVLELSYIDLPPHLKSCFLFLSFFEEDAIISAKKLVQVWIAQGIIPQDDEAEETMEEIARTYLGDLINRNVVEVRDWNKDGTLVKNCKVHDTLRDLCIKKAKEEVGFGILKRNVNNFTSLVKSRHCVIKWGNEKSSASTSRHNRPRSLLRCCVSSDSPCSHVRSLFVYRPKFIDGEEIPSEFWECFESLKVLDLEGIGLKMLSESVCGLIGLRYLCLRGNFLKKLPKSLGCLINLEVLDFAVNDCVEVPNVLWKLDKLRHLFFPSEVKLTTTLKLDTLKNLQSLALVVTDMIDVKHLKQMENLSKLKIRCLSSFSDELFSSLEGLDNLVSLKLEWTSGPISITKLNNLQKLTKLKLHGQLSQLPSANDFPPKLSSLTLLHTALTRDPMPVLEKLPNLFHLQLGFGSFDRRLCNMKISQDGFFKLGHLNVSYASQSMNIQLGKGGLKELKKLEFNYCADLKITPEEEDSRLKEKLQELYINTTSGGLSIGVEEN